MIKVTYDLHGLMLIGLDDGRTLVNITDFYLVGVVRTITAVLFQTEVLLNRRYLVVPQPPVPVLGGHASLVPGRTHVPRSGRFVRGAARVGRRPAGFRPHRARVH